MEMEMEKKFYYAGLSSSPILVARTSTTPWKAPTGPEAYHRLKEIRDVGKHELTKVWNDDLGPKVDGLLDEMKVKWTSLDIVRIGISGESFAPVILWIGVLPSSLSSEDGIVAARKCKELLEEYHITDVDVEIRESVATQWPGGSRAAYDEMTCR
jgi:hypothetical protein